MKGYTEEEQMCNRLVSIIELCHKDSINAHAVNARSYMGKFKDEDIEGKGYIEVEVPKYSLRDLKELVDFYFKVYGIAYSGRGQMTTLFEYKRMKKSEDDELKRYLEKQKREIEARKSKE